VALLGTRLEYESSLRPVAKTVCDTGMFTHAAVPMQGLCSVNFVKEECCQVKGHFFGATGCSHCKVFGLFGVLLYHRYRSAAAMVLLLAQSHADVRMPIQWPTGCVHEMCMSTDLSPCRWAMCPSTQSFRDLEHGEDRYAVT
jgi:hypothetical protein